MQPARIKPHAKEHTNNPVQKPNFRGHAGTMARTRVYKPPTVLQDHQGRENKRASVDLARGKVSGGSRQQAVVRTSLGGSLFREWTHPFPGEPIPSGCGCSSHPPCPRGKVPRGRIDELSQG